MLTYKAKLRYKTRLWRLLELHRNTSTSSSLHDNLGDGYLLQSNPIYRNIRSAAVAMGLRFATEGLGFYELHPWSQLRGLLRDKIVPYSDNVAPLESLEARAPRALTWDIAVAPEANYVFYASALGIASSCSSRLLGPIEMTRAVSRLNCEIATGSQRVALAPNSASEPIDRRAAAPIGRSRHAATTAREQGHAVRRT